MDVMGLVVENGQIWQRLDALEHRRLVSGQVFLGRAAENGIHRIERGRRLLAAGVDLIDVQQEKIAARIGQRAVATQNDLERPLPFPFRWDEW